MRNYLLLFLLTFFTVFVGCETDEIFDLNEQITALEAKVDNEVDRLDQADADNFAALQATIDAVVAAQAEVNAQLDQAIQDEATARAEADAQLTTDLEIEALERKNDVAQLYLDLEAQRLSLTRMMLAHVDTLNTKIAAEAAARLAGDEALTASLTLEIKNRIEQGRRLASSIMSVSNRLTAEVKRIDAVNEAQNDSIVALRSSISSNTILIGQNETQISQTQNAILAAAQAISETPDNVDSYDDLADALDSFEAVTETDIQALEDYNESLIVFNGFLVEPQDDNTFAEINIFDQQVHEATEIRATYHNGQVGNKIVFKDAARHDSFTQWDYAKDGITYNSNVRRVGDFDSETKHARALVKTTPVDGGIVLITTSAIEDNAEAIAANTELIGQVSITLNLLAENVSNNYVTNSQLAEALSGLESSTLLAIDKALTDAKSYTDSVTLTQADVEAYAEALIDTLLADDQSALAIAIAASFNEEDLKKYLEDNNYAKRVSIIDSLSSDSAFTFSVDPSDTAYNPGATYTDNTPEFQMTSDPMFSYGTEMTLTYKLGAGESMTTTVTWELSIWDNEKILKLGNWEFRYAFSNVTNSEISLAGFAMTKVGDKDLEIISFDPPAPVQIGFNFGDKIKAVDSQSLVYEGDLTDITIETEPGYEFAAIGACNDCTTNITGITYSNSAVTEGATSFTFSPRVNSSFVHNAGNIDLPSAIVVQKAEIAVELILDFDGPNGSAPTASVTTTIDIDWTSTNIKTAVASAVADAGYVFKTDASSGLNTVIEGVRFVIAKGNTVATISSADKSAYDWINKSTSHTFDLTGLVEEYVDPCAYLVSDLNIGSTNSKGTATTFTLNSKEFKYQTYSITDVTWTDGVAAGTVTVNKITFDDFDSDFDETSIGSSGKFVIIQNISGGQLTDAEIAAAIGPGYTAFQGSSFISPADVIVKIYLNDSGCTDKVITKNLYGNSDF